MFRFCVLFACLFCVKIPLSAQDYHKSNKSEEQQLGDQLTPLGDLGVMGIFKVGRADIRIHSILGKEKTSGSLRVGDVILAANGKPFEKATNSVDDGGKGPREGLGYAMDESRRKDGKLLLKVKRGSGELELTIRLVKGKGFSAKYPEFCSRSEAMMKRTCDWLLTKQAPGGNFGGSVQTATGALALLSSGDKAYEDSIRRAAKWCMTNNLDQGGLHTWNYVYIGSFLGEYYLAMGDRSVLPRLEAICKELEERTNTQGKHAHGRLGGDDKDQSGYDNKGINIITSHVLLTWALARKCGIEVSQEKWDVTKAHLKRCTEANGGTGYIGAYGNSDGSGRTGLFTLALYISGEEPELQKIQGEYLQRNTRRMREAHANGLFGMIWGTAALASVNPEGYRAHMDYWRWYMELGTAPEGKDIVRWYIPSKRNCGGDSYLNYDLYNHCAMGMWFGSSRKNLFVHGNTKLYWFGKSKGFVSILKQLKKVHKRPADLLTAMIEKQPQLRDPKQLADALPYFKSQQKKSELALEVYQDLHQTMKTYIFQLQGMASLRPAYSYHCMNILKPGIKGDKDLKLSLETLRKVLVKDSKVASLEKVRVEIDKVFAREDQSMEKLITNLRRVRKKLDAFQDKRGLQLGLQLEALFLLRDLNDKIGDEGQ